MSGTVMPTAIPADMIVNVTPSVIQAGGAALDLSGLMLTTSNRVPINQALSFPTQAAVGAYFGLTSTEYALAGNYFSGFDNSNKKPGAMLFAQYNTGAVNAWLRGGSLLSMTLTQLQALSGSLTVTINGTPTTAGAVNLSAATSFSNAAELISTALGLTGPAGASFTGQISGTTLTASGTITGTIAVGQEVKGTGVTANMLITALGTGTGGAGTYTVSISQTIGPIAMTSDTPVVTYDSVIGDFVVQSSTTGPSSTIAYVTGTLAAPLALTQATGAVLSQGAAAATPSGTMTNLSLVTQNWATFSTAFDPDGGSGNTNKLAFATWTTQQNNRFLYVPWDTDVSPSTNANATSSLGNILKACNYSGIAPFWSPTQGATMAAFLMGAVASVDFTETNGRTTMFARTQGGLTADVTSQTVAANLQANSYNFYGIYSTGSPNLFTWIVNGVTTGPFAWIDSYINQIWLNNEFQVAMMELLATAKSIPYNQQGYGMIRSAMLDPILAGANFGAFRPGVTLSQAQIAEVNNSAGFKIDDVLSRVGWYLLIKDASPQVRQARGSPPITFFYVDGQSVQRISIASIEVA